MDRHAQGDLLHLAHALGEILLALGDVGLAEDEDRRGTALPAGREITLDPPRVEVTVEPGHQKDRVDVGGDHLLIGARARGLAGELAPARQDGADQSRLGERRRRPHRHPVADRRRLHPLLAALAMPQPPGRGSRHLRHRRIAGRQLIHPPQLAHDPARNEPLLPVRREIRGEEVVPAEIGEGGEGRGHGG